MSELSGNSGELKPCPFCGKTPASEEHYDADGKLLACFVSCQNLHCSQFTFPKPLPVFKAADWNTRPIEDELLEKVQQLQAKWDAIPWDALRKESDERYARYDDDETKESSLEVATWLAANEPKEPRP